jgi:hypothetical protein
MAPTAATTARTSYAGAAVPRYRIVFPPRPGEPAEHSPTAHVNSGDEIYEVGTLIEHHGRRWRVSQAPLEQEDGGKEADVMVWPAD